MKTPIIETKRTIQLIVSVFLNVILTLLVIVLVSGRYSYQTKETSSNELLSNNVQVTIPTAIIQERVLTTVPTPNVNPVATESKSDQDPIPYYYSDLMVNPIDQAYLPLVTDRNYCQVEYRGFQEGYYIIWKDEYHKVLDILKSKAVYKEDKEIIEQFDKNVESFIDNNSEFFETALLGDYNTDPSSPEKNSWGNGTMDKLLEIRGKIYRDVCVQLITFLDEGDYNYPDEIDFLEVIDETKIPTIKKN